MPKGILSALANHTALFFLQGIWFPKPVMMQAFFVRFFHTKYKLLHEIKHPTHICILKSAHWDDTHTSRKNQSSQMSIIFVWEVNRNKISKLQKSYSATCCTSKNQSVNIMQPLVFLGNLTNKNKHQEKGAIENSKIIPRLAKSVFRLSNVCIWVQAQSHIMNYYELLPIFSYWPLYHTKDHYVWSIFRIIQSDSTSNIMYTDKISDSVGVCIND